MIGSIAVLLLICGIFFAGAIFAKNRIMNNLERMGVLTAKEIVEVMKLWT